MRCLFMFLLVLLVFTCCGQDKVLNKLNKQDSVRNQIISNLSRKNVVTTEIHNVFFRNLYPTRSYNEEEVFKREIDRLNPFDNKIIDTVIFLQLNAFGESVYDTSIHSNNFERFLSKSLHVNTRHKVIRNR